MKVLLFSITFSLLSAIRLSLYRPYELIPGVNNVEGIRNTLRIPGSQGVTGGVDIKVLIITMSPRTVDRMMTENNDISIMVVVTCYGVKELALAARSSATSC